MTQDPADVIASLERRNADLARLLEAARDQLGEMRVSLESALRNPGAADGQQGRLFIGFAAAELLGLLSFVVAMILIFVA